MSKTNYTGLQTGTKIFAISIYNTNTKERIKYIEGVTVNTIRKQLLKYFNEDIFLLVLPQKIIK